MKKLIKPAPLRKGQTIGIIAPCNGMSEAGIAPAVEAIRSLGFEVKLGEHVFSRTDGYGGSAEERASDFNSMIADDSVSMLLFPGGEIAIEILPLIDYEAIKKHPKIICSYSDGTFPVEAVHSMTGLVTFYGGSTRTFDPVTEYNFARFTDRLVTGSTEYVSASEWRTVCPGKAEGVIAAGYLANYDTLLRSDYYSVPEEDCILVIEDHEKFSDTRIVSRWLNDMIQKGAFEHATGLIFGHYTSDPEKLEKLFAVLRRIGEKMGIPVVYTDDFGHGANMSIFPVGIRAAFDTADGSFRMFEAGVDTSIC